MSTLPETAPAFVELAHRIVWATVATVGPDGRPRTRVLHPIWVWDGASLVGWIATGPTPLKVAHLEAHPEVSLTYWDPTHDTATAECRASWHLDDETRTWLWDHFKTAPAPVGYDPAIIPPVVRRAHLAGVRGPAPRPDPPAGAAGGGHDRRPERPHPPLAAGLVARARLAHRHPVLGRLVPAFPLPGELVPLGAGLRRIVGLRVTRVVGHRLAALLLHGILEDGPRRHPGVGRVARTVGPAHGSGQPP